MCWESRCYSDKSFDILKSHDVIKHDILIITKYPTTSDSLKFCNRASRMWQFFATHGQTTALRRRFFPGKWPSVLFFFEFLWKYQVINAWTHLFMKVLNLFLYYCCCCFQMVFRPQTILGFKRSVKLKTGNSLHGYSVSQSSMFCSYSCVYPSMLQKIVMI